MLGPVCLRGTPDRLEAVNYAAFSSIGVPAGRRGACLKMHRTVRASLCDASLIDRRRVFIHVAPAAG